MRISGNALIMKEINVNLVRRTLKAQKQATKHQIAEATGLSTVTVATILQELAENQEVFDAGFAASRGGRPAQLFRFNENHAHVLILFMHEQDGLDRLYLRVVNLFGSCIHEQDTALDNIHLHSFEPYIDSALEEYPSIQAIGFGLPGVVLEGKFDQGDYPGLVGSQLLPHYEERYHLPVLFENDVNAASVGYSKRTQMESRFAVIYLYFPQKYRPGAGIYIDGTLYKGHSNYAGEIGNLPVDVNWLDPTLYTTFERICGAITGLISIINSLLNPYSIVLYGSFLTDAHLEAIQQQCASQLASGVVPLLKLTHDFTHDYQIGMIEETLALLEPQIAIYR